MRKYLAWALLALTVCVYAGIPSNIRVTAVLTPGGKVDTRYRDGDDGTATVPLTWATIPTLAGVQGTPQSINLRSAYLTEPGSPNATLTVDCAPPLSGGWTTTTNGLDYTYSGAYSGTCQVTATRNIVSVGVSNFFSVTSTATASADSTAPAQVIGLTALATSTGIRLTWRPSSDPKNSQTWSGLSGYKIYRDGSGTALATVNAPDTGMQVQLTGAELGGSSGGSITQTGANYSLVTTGDGIGGTAENGYFAYQAVSGNFRLCAEVHGISGGDAVNANMVLSARQSTAADDLAVFERQNYTSVRPRYRGTVAQTTQSAGTQVTQAPAAWHCLGRNGTTWTTEYSPTGVTFTTTNTVNPGPMANQMLVGVLGGTGGSTTTTGDIRGVILTNHPDLTYDDAITDGASHSYIVKAIDGATNLSAASVSASATAPGTADTTGPAAPTAITCTGTSTSVIQCSWTPPTDPSGIATCTPAVSTTLGGTYTDQTPVTVNSYSITGLAPSTSRYLKVKCTDGAGNVGTQSTPGVQGTSAAASGDTTAPTVPSGNCYVGANWNFNDVEPAHTPCATGLSTTTFRIKTTGSTDAGCGVASYRLYRSTSASGPFLLATSFNTTQFDYVLSPAQPGVNYYFKLSAMDCAGNESAQSATFSDRLTLSSGGAVGGAGDQWNSVCATCGQFWIPGSPPIGYPYDDPNYGSQWTSGSDPSLTAGQNGCLRALDNTQAISGTAFHFKQNNQIQGAHCMLNYQGLISAGRRANFIPGKEYYYSFSIYLPSTGHWTLPNAAGRFVIVNQIHGNNLGTANNPHFKVDVGLGTGNPWEFQVLGDLTMEKPYDRNVKYKCGTVTENTWHRFTIQVLFGDPGYLKVYHNDELCMSDVGLNYFVGEIPAGGAGPYTTLGVYNGWSDRLPGAPSSPSDAECRADPSISVWCTPPDGNREGWIDDFRSGRGDQGVSYQEVTLP